MSLRRIAAPIATSLFGILAAVGLAECGARVLIARDPASAYAEARNQHNAAMRGRFYAFDPQLGWVLRAGASGLFTAPDFSSTVHIDARGFRAMPPPPPSPRGRVWVLGDSVAFGYGVDDDQTFSARLAATHPELAVENLAVSGYGTDQELLLLRRELARGRPGEPTTLVVTFYLNDLLDNQTTGSPSYPKPRFDVAPDGALMLTGVPVAQPPPASSRVDLDDWLGARSRLWSTLRPRLQVVLVRAGWETAENAVDDYLGFFLRRDRARRAGRWATWRAIMDGLVREARAAGLRPVVLVVPVRTQADAQARARLERVYHMSDAELDLDEPDQEIDRWAQTASVPVAHALPLLREAAAHGTSPYFAFDPHPNPQGHELLFRALEPLVR
jgi:hypothetical protein